MASPREVLSTQQLDAKPSDDIVNVALELQEEMAKRLSERNPADVNRMLNFIKAGATLIAQGKTQDLLDYLDQISAINTNGVQRAEDMSQRTDGSRSEILSDLNAIAAITLAEQEELMQQVINAAKSSSNLSSNPSSFVATIGQQSSATTASVSSVDTETAALTKAAAKK